MPKVTITEVDKTSRTPIGGLSVLPIAIIGTADKGPIESPKEVTTLVDFNAMFGTTCPDTYRHGYIAARELLMLGAPVLYTRIAGSGAVAATVTVNDVVGPDPTPVGVLDIVAATKGKHGNEISVTIASAGDGVYTATVTYLNAVVDTLSFTMSSLPVSNEYVVISKAATAADKTPLAGTYELSGGASGDDMTNAEVLSGVDGALTALADTSLYEFLVVSAPGLTAVADSGTKVTEKFTAWTRDDCVSIIDTTASTVAANVITDTGLPAPSGLTETTGYPDIAVFYPWWTKSVDITSRTELLPASIFYLMAFVESGAISTPWNAVAGVLNGKATGALSTTATLGEAMAETVRGLYANPIATHRGYGYFIDGNNVYNPAARSRTMSQLSVRLSICYAKQRLRSICKELSYQQSASTVRTEFMGRATNLLDSMKDADALYNYRVILLDSADDLANGIVRAQVRLFPVNAVDEYKIDLEIVNVETAL
jgi:hypothetical protein